MTEHYSLQASIVIDNDPRYPTLVLEEGDKIACYAVNLDDLSLRRVCCCHAKCSTECVCGIWND